MNYQKHLDANNKPMIDHYNEIKERIKNLEKLVE